MMKNGIRLSIGILLLTVLILLVFRNWFSNQEIAAGDAPFYFQENLKLFSISPQLWNTRGLGHPDLVIYPFFYLTFPLIILSNLNFPWVLIERIVWYFPFIIIGIASSAILFLTIFQKSKFLFLAPLIYVFNSYILLIVGGGQISIALAYALAPLVLALFIRNMSYGNSALSIISSLIWLMQLTFEPRLAVITLVISLCYGFFTYRLNNLKYLKTYFLPLVIVIGFHSYWILPALLSVKNTSPANLSSPDWLNFLSFTNFENSISLLHPNWPENIFGKTYFMKWEFLFMPILAFSSLLFINLKSKIQNSKLQFKIKNYGNVLAMKQCSNETMILFFALLGLIGAFLAKGINLPFGEINELLYVVIPGMNTFRDPTKFYILVALSYSVLIPYSLRQISTWINSKFSVKWQNFLGSLPFLLFIFYFLFLIKPAWSGELGGTFKTREVPKEYVALKDFLISQPGFFRTFWIPKKQRFGFYSNNHPAINAHEFFNSTDLTQIVGSLKDEKIYETISEMSIKYLIVPYDSEGELFLTERKYDDSQRLKLVEELDKISWLKKINLPCAKDSGPCDKISIYETLGYKDHFWINPPAKQQSALSWQMIKPTKYIVSIERAFVPFTLIFSESYDPNWVALTNGKEINSTKFMERFNSFSINDLDSSQIIIEYKPQRFVNFGLIISGGTVFIAFICLLICKRQESHSSLI